VEGSVKREILHKLLKMEVKIYEDLAKGIIPKGTAMQALADEYGCTANKIAVIKCYYKQGGINALVDDKPRGGIRNGAGRPTKKGRIWHAQRGEIKEGNKWIKDQEAANKIMQDFKVREAAAAKKLEDIQNLIK
jgi:hypothetical protein